MALDPQAQFVLEIAEKSGRPLLETLSPSEARALYEEMAKVGGGTPPAVFRVEEITATGPFGPIPLRIYVPRDANDEKLPVLIYFHGGGYVIGSRNSHDIPCRSLALNGDCIVVSVDYRMAPEFPFPQPVEDCWAAANWIVKNVQRLGGCADKIAIGGDSAGGNLATVICLMAKERNGPNFIHQLLIYPGTDMTKSHPSHEQLAEGYRLTKSLINWFMNHYFSGEITDRTHPLASPLLADDLSGLPPVTLISAGYDPLKDENAAYVKRLEAAGVTVEHHHYGGMIHGFINMPAFLDAATHCMALCGSALRRNFTAA